MLCGASRRIAPEVNCLETGPAAKTESGGDGHAFKVGHAECGSEYVVPLMTAPAGQLGLSWRLNLAKIVSILAAASGGE